MQGNHKLTNLLEMASKNNAGALSVLENAEKHNLLNENSLKCYDNFKNSTCSRCENCLVDVNVNESLVSPNIFCRVKNIDLGFYVSEFYENGEIVRVERSGKMTKQVIFCESAVSEK